MFEDFNALIQQGEMILLTGKSGAGKTTLLRLLMKETPLTGGKITVFGEDISLMGRNEVPFYRRKIGIVFQEPSLVSRLNVYENVELARLAAGGSKRDSRTAISSLLRLTGISHLHKSCPEQLSGGEKQRVCLARALANYPKLLPADEPTGNLSPAESREIMKLFEVVHQQGITVIIATHDVPNAAGLPYREIPLEREGK